MSYVQIKQDKWFGELASFLFFVYDLSGKGGGGFKPLSSSNRYDEGNTPLVWVR